MQQHAEIPQHWLPKEASAPLPEKITKEQSLFMRLGKAAADMVSDIRSANDMAKRKFDGDSALMRVARGALTGAVGAGLELATDDMFSKAWRGEGPIFERFVMGESAGKKLAALSEKHPRISHFVKEGTQDVALAALYNFIAYRSQPIFTQVESPHVLRSLAANAFEAGFVQSIPDEMKGAASRIKEKRVEKWKYRGGYRGNKQRAPKKYPFGVEGSVMQMNDALGIHKPGQKQLLHKRTLTSVAERGMVGSIFNLSNPVTQLGVEMMWNGLSTFAKNYKELRQTRKLKDWSGGKAGAPNKGENVYYGNSYNKYNKKRGYDERLED
ncbi:hypothetical protein HZB58_05690 [Candidatus Gottesmanbacteria bacterium]|nr:hypothetical protein [Candidatus Gottesmanbacteria bacterium]